MREEPKRRHFAGDDYLTEFPAGAPHRLMIDTGVPRPTWQARIPGDQLRAPHPGTGLLFEGRYYEIVRAEAVEAGSRRVHYYLDLWDDRHTLRQAVQYDRDSCQRALADHLQVRRDRQRARWLRLFGPVVALLPAADQRELESSYHFPAVRNTVVSAILLWLPSTTLTVFSIGLGFAGHVPADLVWVGKGSPIYWYFFLESAVRYVSGWKTAEPMGSLPVCLPVELWRALRRLVEPAERRRRSQEGELRRRRSRDFSQMRDEVRNLGGSRATLEILSLLPKEHWTVDHTAVQYQGVWYLVVGRECVGKGRNLRYRFLIEEYQGDLLPRHSYEYRPEEVQDIHRARQRREKGTWVGTFAPLWGFLDADTQRELEACYEYDALGSMLQSSVAGGLLGGTAFVVACVYLGSGQGDLPDLFMLLLGLYLMVESGIRWARAKREQLGGGLLGLLLKPLARRLLD